MSQRAKRAASASLAVQREWLRRIEAEYRSAAITHSLTGWLIQAGAPSLLVRQGLRIVADEVSHAELSAAVYRAAGGTATPMISEASLGLARTSGTPLILDIAMYGTRVFCLGETAAVRLFSAMRKRTTVPVAKRALDRVLRDEVRHRDFGWLLLDWLLATPAEPVVRQHLAPMLPKWIAELRLAYGGKRSLKPSVDVDAPEANSKLGDADRAWGLMPSVEYVTIFDGKIRADYERRFAQRRISL